MCIRGYLLWKGNWKYVIVERNPHTVKDQQKILDDYENRITWKTSLAEVDRFCGCIITNELLDALPVHLVLMNDRFREIYVDSYQNQKPSVWHGGIASGTDSV
jgi:SAM-dependent MidA family methyltransferase